MYKEINIYIFLIENMEKLDKISTYIQDRFENNKGGVKL